MIELRDYQSDAIDQVRKAYRDGHRRILLVAPTGSGKTIIGTHVLNSAAEKHKAGMWVAPRREIVKQTAEKLEQLECSHGILMAGHERSVTADVQVASIQTYHRRKNKKGFLPPGGNVIVFDEAHLSLARSWQELAADYPGGVILGLTATPCRGDGAGLGSFWEVLIEVTTVEQLMLEGWLVRAKFFAPTMPDLDGVHTRGGDFVKEELGERMDKAHLVGDIVDNWIEHAQGRPTVVFASTVAHSRHIVEAFNAAGYEFLHLDGKTPKDERDNILGALDRGDINGVSNCQVLHEGWDQPLVSCMVDAQPTKSYGRHLQKVGRILRPAENKTDALVIDHAGNVYRHGFPEEAGGWTLDDGVKVQDVRKEKRERSDTLQTCRECFTVFEGAGCPGCGAQVTAKARQINVEEGRLIEVKKKARKLDKQATWLECLFQASYKNLKVGAAAHMYRKKIGTWPGRNLKRVPRSTEWQLFAKDFIERTRGNDGQTRDILTPAGTIEIRG